MRGYAESRKRWDTLRSGKTFVDLKDAVKNSEDKNVCEDGLRSICWKAFLLYGNPDQATWLKQLAESRSAYISLRQHFLRFIEHPDDLESSVDPLSEDAESPWQSIRQDEAMRAEIFQDVQRCLQDNFFFREPKTQTQLLDILFIYAKLNPDVGYRQGMHELLAPVLWVVERDAIDPTSIARGASSDRFMLDALDADYVEHDSFAIFCAIMQTAKAFYELGDPSKAGGQDNSPIVTKSRRIHDEVLGALDPELATHLQAIEILPQIFLIRWVRLLFGREFEFEDVLCMWDVLFAESLDMTLIDLVCVSMLLRIRWKLMKADYSTALTLLLRYPAPGPKYTPITFVQDALFLKHQQTSNSAANIVLKYTGKRPTLSSQPHSSRPQTPDRDTQNHRHQPSPLPKQGRSSPGIANLTSARFLQPRSGGLEALFQDVSGEIQRRTESWNVAKTVRGAMEEVRKNVVVPRSSPIIRPKDPLSKNSTTTLQTDTLQVQELSNRLDKLENRNKALAKMLEDALGQLRAGHERIEKKDQEHDEAFNVALARIQFVQVYLEDLGMPIPEDIPVEEKAAIADALSGGAVTVNSPETVQPAASPPPPAAEDTKLPPPQIATPPTDTPLSQPQSETQSQTPRPTSPSSTPQISKLQPQPRPSLAQSSFSWMLGENHHRSSFVSSVSVEPEELRKAKTKERRESVNKGKTKGGITGRKKGVVNRERVKRSELFGDGGGGGILGEDRSDGHQGDGAHVNGHEELEEGEEIEVEVFDMGAMKAGKGVF